MVDITTWINNLLEGFNSSILEQVPPKYQILLNIALYTIVIAVYAIFIWKFYRFLARRNLLELNLRQYNRTERPGLNKFLASVFFLLEYVIILPIIIFFWFAIFSIFLLVLSESQTVSQILLIAAAIVAAVRLTSYYSEDLSRDLAKIFPFTVLAIFLLNPNFLKVETLTSRITEIPALFNHILFYLLFIFALEVIMRTLFTVIQLFSSGSREESVVISGK